MHRVETYSTILLFRQFLFPAIIVRFSKLFQGHHALLPAGGWGAIPSHPNVDNGVEMATRTLHRLTEAVVRNARPLETIVPLSDAAIRAIRRHPGFSRAEKEIKGAVQGIRNGKTVIVRRRTRWMADGGSLWLAVVPSPHDPDACSKSWVFRYTLPEKVTSRNGKVRQRQRQMGLGSANTLRLDEVRELARECRKQVLAGIDPLTARRGMAAQAKVAELHLKTFDTVRDEYLMNAAERWSPVHAKNWRQSIQDHVSPVIGNVPISVIDTALVIKVLEPLWEKHPITARRVRGRMEDILAYGAFKHYREDPNPARWRGHLQLNPGFNAKTEVKHFASLPFKDIASFMRQLRAVGGIPSLALQWTILTCARTGETRQALASEIDWERQLWLVPRGHKKTRRHMDEDYFIVPLTDAAMAVLAKIGKREPDERLFPMHSSAMLEVAQGLNSGIDVHGFRATFRTWSEECTETDSIVIKACMSHKVGTKVDLAYHRGPQFLEKRRRHLQEWSDHFAAWTEGAAGNVIRMGKA
jgi:integrase